MDGHAGLPSSTSLLSQFGQVGIPAFVISTFGPSIQAKLAKHPKLMRYLSVVLTLYLTISLGSSFLMGWFPRFWGSLMSYGMSHVDVSSSDVTLNRDVIQWLATKRLVMVERFQSARSAFYLRQRQRDMGYSHSRRRSHATEDSRESGIVFTPKNDLQIFWHKGKLFVLTMSNALRESFGAVPLTIWCFGWSPKPIQDLLVEIQEAQRLQENVLTQILTPQSGCGSNWIEQTLKRARPLDSVYLEPAQKAKLIDDMTEYLNGETRAWYQDRGIPYRRGYLFHGAPGCGKSSLALALAGHFKLNVYMVSLMASGLNDYNLQYLFQALQPGCLVLLEDVDSAGLVREGMMTAAEKRRRKGKRGKRLDREDYDHQNNHRDVTLSGLLNAIDGPGSPEGHILIMTTNCPDELDDALVRAGRVDVKVEFKHANNEQVRDIFYSMYKVKDRPKVEKVARVSEDIETESDEKCNSSPDEPKVEEEEEDPNIRINVLADQFASFIPEHEFSPAQLQDYILLHKNQPQRAVDEMAKWLKEHFEEKALLEADEESSSESESEEDSDSPRTPSNSEPVIVVPATKQTKCKKAEGSGAGIKEEWLNAIMAISAQFAEKRVGEEGLKQFEAVVE